MEKKQFALAILFILVLTVMFAPLSGQQGSSSYDSWLDYNGDGNVDASDLQALAQTYGGSGDPTRNVNVTNWPKEPEPKMITVVQNFTVTNNDWGRVIATINVEGYRYVSIFVAYLFQIGTDFATLIVQPSCSNITAETDGRAQWYVRYLRLDVWPSWQNRVSPSFTAGAPCLSFELIPQNIGEGMVTIVLYCYN